MFMVNLSSIKIFLNFFYNNMNIFKFLETIVLNLKLLSFCYFTYINLYKKKIQVNNLLNIFNFD